MIQTAEVQLGSLTVDFSTVGSKLLEPQLVEKFCHILSTSVIHIISFIIRNKVPSYPTA